MRIIPAIDIIGGQCVRLTQGDYTTKKVYDADPVSVAKEYDAMGIKHLHLVDLDGAKSGRPVNLDILEKITKETKLTVDFGGGIRSRDHLEQVLSLGANAVNLGSLAVKEMSVVKFWIQGLPSDTIYLSSDVKDGIVKIAGWHETSTWNIFDLVEEYRMAGLKTIVCTDISRDGAMRGVNLELYNDLRHRYPDLFIIASGGVTSLNDLDELSNMNIDGVIIGKAIYEGLISLKELVAYVN